MNLLRVASGIVGMMAGIVVVGYALGWMVQRVAQVIAATIGIASGGLVFLAGVTAVTEELRENKHLAKTLKSAQEQLSSDGLSKGLKATRSRIEPVRREASKLWR